MSDKNERPGDKRDAATRGPDAAQAAEEETAAKRIETDTRANKGLGLALRPEAEDKSRTEEIVRRAANRNDR